MHRGWERQAVLLCTSCSMLVAININREVCSNITQVLKYY